MQWSLLWPAKVCHVPAHEWMGPLVFVLATMQHILTFGSRHILMMRDGVDAGYIMPSGPGWVSAGYSEVEVSALTSEIPAKWERLGDLALLPKEAFLSPQWAGLGGRLWDTVAGALPVARLARQGPIANTG